MVPFPSIKKSNERTCINDRGAHYGQMVQDAPDSNLGLECPNHYAARMPRSEQGLDEDVGARAVILTRSGLELASTQCRLCFRSTIEVVRHFVDVCISHSAVRSLLDQVLEACDPRSAASAFRQHGRRSSGISISRLHKSLSLSGNPIFHGNMARALQLRNDTVPHQRQTSLSCFSRPCTTALGFCRNTC